MLALPVRRTHRITAFHKKCRKKRENSDCSMIYDIASNIKYALFQQRLDVKAILA
jgi:hypothetical protein